MCYFERVHDDLSEEESGELILVPELDDLSERHRAFVLALFTDSKGNYEDARRRAGFKRVGEGKRLAKRDDVQAAIKAIRARADGRKVMQALELQEILTSVIRGEHTMEIVRQSEDGPVTMTVEVPWAVRLQAGRDLTKLLGWRAPEKKKIEHEHAHTIYFPLAQPPEELEWNGPLELPSGSGEAELDAIEAELVAESRH